MSWGRHLAETMGGAAAGGCRDGDGSVSLLPRLPESTGGRDCEAHIELDTCGISPMDEHNAKLLVGGGVVCTEFPRVAIRPIERPKMRRSRDPTSRFRTRCTR